ncbi:peptidase [Virgisporangium aurantiacum]|uniref:Peptidase n=1 Tax=Virgisporangium aurantiacum TaxID=175570 RepID=A0A8J3Z9Y0_9ACTN|nr:peptidase [Virgisporangium aurantiacum]
MPAQPASAVPAGPAGPVAAPAALGGGTATTVTLITGDTVRYAVDRAGRASATVDPGDGRDTVTFRGYTQGDGYYLLPSDAEQPVRAGLLDRRLFDVAYLASNGYGNDRTTELPVIVQYERESSAEGLARSAQALPSARSSAALPSVNGAAVRVGKPSAAKFWDAVRAGAGVRKVWLDGKVTAVDDVSVAQIGAPAAWAAGLDGTGVSVGIIDTGIDATHQDLRGKVAAARNFVEAGQPGGNAPEDVTDRHGHGTHVASIIAGSGAASNGRYTGVAPNATLTIAKALDDSGNGTDSAVIAAMQWQAPRVRVVSMSLGGAESDGTDPVSQAVNDLTAEYGTLFVIAAGNKGPDTRTVAQPGAATAALTVGAVDSADALADFSSRGPRLGDFAIKPEITAPGVRIIAARAAGTSMGTPTDANYTAASGTSMATPHVAAAAAILAQQNPAWRADQLKTTLIGSAKNTGGSVYAEGAGRVDIARSIRQRVFVDTPSVSAAFTYPPTGETLTRTVTYRNAGSADVDLSLSASMTGPDGRPAPAGVAAVDRTAVRVPAGGTAGVRLTLDPRPAGQGLHSGRLVAASATGDQLVVPIGFQAQVKQATITIRVIGGPDRYVFGGSFTEITTLRVNDTTPELAMEPISTSTYNWRKVDGEPNTYESKVRLAEGGVYMVEGNFSWQDLTTGRNHLTFLHRPEVKLTGDTTITFDMNKAVPVGFETPRPSTAVNVNIDWQRVVASGQHYYGFLLGSFWTVAVGQLWVFPSDAVTVGKFAVGVNEILSAPQATLRINGLTLRPVYTRESSANTPKFGTDRRLRVVTEADLRAGRDVAGALVFLRGSDIRPTVELAVAAKAAGVLADAHIADLMYLTDLVGIPIPLLYVDRRESKRVADVLAGSARPTADIEAHISTPYQYKLVNYQYNRIPASMTARPGERDLTRLETTYHAQTPAPAGKWGPADDGNDVSFTYLPGQLFSVHAGHSFHGHGQRTEYFSTTGADVLWWRQYQFTAGSSMHVEHTYRGFARPTTGVEEWNEPNVPVNAQAGPQTPAGAAVFWPCDGCRQGDVVRVRSLAPLGVGQYAGRSDPSHTVQEDGPTEEVHLYTGSGRSVAEGGDGGSELPPHQDAAGLTYYRLPAGAATYRLTSGYTTGSPHQSFARTVDTTWTFRSAAPAADTVAQPYWCIDELLYGDTTPCGWLPLIHLGYRLGLAPDDSAPAGRPFTFTVTGQVGAPGSAAKLAGLRAWTSVDGGAHWVPARAVRADNGGYRVTVWNPRVADAPSGRVSIRIEAWDRDGNAVQQVLDQAYALRTAAAPCRTAV